jgi:hypothetical protein
MHVVIVREDFDTGDLPFLSAVLEKISWQDFWRSHAPRGASSKEEEKDHQEL